MRRIPSLTTLLDLLFPPSADELRVRALTLEKLMHLRTIPYARDIETLFSYKNADVRALLWQLKYKNDRRSAELLGAVLADYLQETVYGECILIPLPLAPARERARGFNQVDSVCRSMVRSLPRVAYLPRALARVRNTTPQTSLSRYERLKNMHGAFAVPDPVLIRGKDILLIDDVTTTGATLREAKDALMHADVHSVRCIALAH